MFCPVFLYLQFGFVIFFGTKIFGAKVARKKLAKLTTDCNRVIYQQSISTQKFRTCDEKNFGMSDLCSLQNYLPKPQIWGTQILNQLPQNQSNLTNLREQIETSEREMKPTYIPKFLFTDLKRTYEAYEKDIAILNVFFSSPSVMQYTTKQSKTWLDFISAFGGNVGLFVGCNIITLLEIVWLIIRTGNLYLQPTNN